MTVLTKVTEAFAVLSVACCFHFKCDSALAAPLDMIFAVSKEQKNGMINKKSFKKKNESNFAYAAII